LHNAQIVNEGKTFNGGLVIDGEVIAEVFEGNIPQGLLPSGYNKIDLQGQLLIPGVIDDQVHFRDPGLTHKGDIFTESRAALAGGVTTFMDMPNVKPQTTTLQLLEEKHELAATKSLANYSFYLGATNDNIDEVLKLDPRASCGIKIFMGSSTGNMLVDNEDTLSQLFKNCPLPIAVHCEHEPTVKANLARAKEQFGDNIPVEYHPVIRDAEACYRSSSMAVELASRHGARLHLLHLSTARELALLDNHKPLTDKKITGEVCVHHLWFDDRDYATRGAFIRWNPAIKSEADKLALIDAVKNGKLDVVATDHAPHLLEEKTAVYTSAMSGGPLVQHSLVAMLEMHKRGIFSIETIVQRMCHAPADLFNVSKRGYIKAGYYADLAVVNLHAPWMVSKSNILYKCGWSPFEGTTFSSKVTKTFVNGKLVFDKDTVNETHRGRRLEFTR